MRAFRRSTLTATPANGGYGGGAMIRGKLLLVVSTGSTTDEREFVLEKQTITLGRAPDNDIVLPSPMVSRHHARLVFLPDPTIEDLNSTLGTIVGDEQISGR